MTTSKENMTRAKENQGPMGRGKKLDSLFTNPKKADDEPFELAKADQKRKGRNTGADLETTSEDLETVGEEMADDHLDKEVKVGGWEAQATNDGSTEQVSNDPKKAQQQTPHYPED